VTIFLVFPHQVFKDLSPLQGVSKVCIIEEYLFFRQYAFHKQKLAFHRACMRYYERYLLDHGIDVEYIESTSELSDIRVFVQEAEQRGITELRCYDPCDDWLSKRLGTATVPVNFLPSPLFLNASSTPLPVRADGSIVQTDWYVAQRKQRKILIENGKPVGGSWTYDTENRKRYPKGMIPPRVQFPQANEYSIEAAQYTLRNFAHNPGEVHPESMYPLTHSDAERWLDDFLQQRFAEYGPYEDAIVSSEHWLNHSVLTPMLNVGLLTPDYVVNTALAHAERYATPLASLEGFVRQILGWREFIRLFYEHYGSAQRTRNYWNFTRDIPSSFYTGTTGIAPIDHTIKKLLQTGYNHHIERLMILGNFMLLCEFHPDAVYRWFMEMYIDAYDWVMVPNVYGMSQFADGGMMCTKPYISGSNYVLKMSDYKADGHWEKIWDALFWRFMHKQRDFFGTNPRLGMLLKTLDRMPAEKQEQMWRTAAEWDAVLVG
jgi:deoxyribodipyrimidine photolyase-related protein